MGACTDHVRPTVSGCIYNDSAYHVEYCVFGAMERIDNLQFDREFKPEIAVESTVTTTKGTFKGTNSRTLTKLAYHHNFSYVHVSPHSISNTGLSNIEVRRSRLTLGVRIRDQDVKIIILNAIINHASDITIFVRADLRVQNLNSSEATFARCPFHDSLQFLKLSQQDRMKAEVEAQAKVNNSAWNNNDSVNQINENIAVYALHLRQSGIKAVGANPRELHTMLSPQKTKSVET